MRPSSLNTRIFLDGGDLEETKQLIELTGFLDGQTTNPSLVAKNPEIQARLERGEKFSNKELWSLYRKLVKNISALIPEGSVSIEVYAENETPAEHMLEQAQEMNTWIPNAHIKLPSNFEGVRAAHMAVQHDIRVNMTLCFSMHQAAAVHAATRGAERGSVFVSPFAGRLDDISENGMKLIENILTMYRQQNSHVMTLAASLRHRDHLMQSIKMSCDILTAPFSLLRDWARDGMPLPGDDYSYPENGYRNSNFIPLDLNREWLEFSTIHQKTIEGIDKFSRDWQNLLQKQ